MSLSRREFGRTLAAAELFYASAVDRAAQLREKEATKHGQRRPAL
jgi:hypothetical protein